MPLREQPTKPANESNLFGAKIKVQAESNLFPTTGESNLFPDIAGLEQLQGMMTPPLIDIGMSEKDDLNKPNFFLRLVGIQEGIESTIKSSTYQQFNELAKEAEASDSFWARNFLAPRMRDAAARDMATGVAITVADFESRPRRAFVNIIALTAQRRMDKVKNPRAVQTPLVKQNYVDAISRAWSGEQDMGMIQAVEGALAPGYRVALDKFMIRHPRVAKIMNVVDAVEEVGVAILTEILIAKGVGVAGKGARALTKIKFAGRAKATDTIADFVTDTVHHAIRLDTDADDIAEALIKQFGNDQSAIDNAFEEMLFFMDDPAATALAIQGVKTPDDMVRGLIYRQYIFDAIKTKTNPSGVIRQADMNNIIDAFTFGKKKMYNQLDISELEDIAQQVESIKLAPARVRNNMLEMLRRKSYGPTVNTYAKLGLEYNYSRVMSAIYQGNDEYNGFVVAMIRGKKRFKKLFKKAWVADDLTDNAFSYALEGTKYDDLPVDLIGKSTVAKTATTGTLVDRFPVGTVIEHDTAFSGVFGTSAKRGTLGKGTVTGSKLDPTTGEIVLELDGGKKIVTGFDNPRTISAVSGVTTGGPITRAQYDFLLEKATELRDGWLDHWADIAEFQGKISSDPAQIAAGVPPRIDNHYHRVHDNIANSVMKRIKDAEEAGKKITIPVDYDLDALIKAGIIPEGKPSSAWITRKAVDGKYSRNATAVLQAYARGVTYDLFGREEILNIKAAIKALPVDEGLRKTALETTRQWALTIQKQPTGIDTTLNKAFNWGSRKMENLFPKWEAQERTFENMAKWLNRRTDQALLLANMRPTVRNLFQPLLTTSSIYGHKATLWGYRQIVMPGGRKLLKTSQVYLTRGVPLAMFDVTDPKSWSQLTYLGIHLTDKYINVANAYLTGWRYYFRRSQKSWDELVTFAKVKGISEQSLKRGNTFSDTLADAINAGHFHNIRRTIDFRGIGSTQWLYDPASMPPSLRTTFGRTIGKYSSWTQNMWGANMPQQMEQLIHGRDIFDQKLGLWNPKDIGVRYALIGTMAKGALLYTVGESVGISMAHLAVTGSLPQTYIMGRPMPIPVGPTAGTIVGLAATGVGLATGTLKAVGTMSIGALSEDNIMLDLGTKQLWYSLKSYMPGYALGKQALRVGKGEQHPAGILWPIKPDKKKKAVPTIGGFPTFKKVKGLPSFPKFEK